jgi:hypothetical protein
MNKEAGMVDSVIARNCSPSGMVASAGSADKLRPTSAEVEISSEVPVISIAWASASRPTSR